VREKPKNKLQIFFSKEIIVVIFLVGFSVTFLTTANGYLLTMTNLDLYLEHDLIVMGQVLSLRDIVNEANTTPRTAYEIIILQHVKGNTESNEITVVGLGSLNSTMQLGDQTILSESQLVLLMLNEHPDGTLYISPYSSSPDFLDPDSQFILPPLKLYKAGIPAEDIHCKSNLKLALKLFNENPVCLKPKSFDRLYERGWIK
jgi:hypothetical protein